MRRGEDGTTDPPVRLVVGICLVPVMPLWTFSYMSFGVDIMEYGMPLPDASILRSGVAGSQGEHGGGHWKQFSKMIESFAHPSVTAYGASVVPHSFPSMVFPDCLILPIQVSV